MRSQFVTDVLVRIRTMAYEGARAIVDSIDRNDGKFIGRTSMKTASLIATLRKMDFYGDRDLTDLVDTLEDAVRVSDDHERDVTAIREAAQSMYEWARQSLGQIDRDVMSEVVMRADRANERNRESTQRKQAERAARRGAMQVTQAEPERQPQREMTITVPKNRRRRTIKRRAEG